MVNMRTLASSVSSTAITTHQNTLSHGSGQQALFSTSTSSRCMPLLAPNINARFLGSSGNTLTSAATGSKLVTDSVIGPGKLMLTVPCGGKLSVDGSGGGKSSSCSGGGKVPNSGNLISGDLGLTCGVEVLSDLSGAMEEWQLLGGSSLPGGLGRSGSSDGGAGIPGLQDIIEASISPSSNAAVARILDEVENSMTEMQRLLLYLRLPTTATTGGPLAPGCSGGGGGGGVALSGAGDGQQAPPSSMLADSLKHPSNPLGSRAEIQLTITWIRTHLTLDTDVSMPKREVYNEYTQFCAANSSKPLSTADFGKVMKQVFPNVRPRRLGQRGASKYCYSGLRKTGSLPRPHVPDLFEDEDNKASCGPMAKQEDNMASCVAVAKQEDTKCWWNNGGSSFLGKNTPVPNTNNAGGNNNNSGLNQSAQILVLEWAEKMLCNNNKRNGAGPNTINNSDSNSSSSISNNKNGMKTSGGIKMEGTSNNNNNSVASDNNGNNNQESEGGGNNTNTSNAIGKRGRYFGSSSSVSDITSRTFHDGEDTSATVDEFGGGTMVFSSLVDLANHLVAEKLVDTRSHHATVVARNCTAGNSGTTSSAAARPRDSPVNKQLNRKLQEREQKRKLQLDTSSTAHSVLTGRVGPLSSLPLADKQQKMRRRSTSTSGGVPPPLLPVSAGQTSSCSSSGISSACSSTNSSRNPSGDSVASNSSGVSSLSSLSSCSSLNTILPGTSSMSASSCGVLTPPHPATTSSSSSSGGGLLSQNPSQGDVKPNIVSEYLNDRELGSQNMLGKTLVSGGQQLPPHTKTATSRVAPIQHCVVGSVITTCSNAGRNGGAGSSSDALQGKWSGSTSQGQLGRLFSQKSLVIISNNNPMSIPSSSVNSSGSGSLEIVSSANGKVPGGKIVNPGGSMTEAGASSNTASKLILGTSRYKSIHPKLSAATTLQGSLGSNLFAVSTSMAGGTTFKGKNTNSSSNNNNMQEFTAADIDSLMNQTLTTNMNQTSSKNVCDPSAAASSGGTNSKFSPTFNVAPPSSRSSCSAGGNRMLAGGSYLAVADTSSAGPSANSFLQASLHGQGSGSYSSGGLVRSESYTREDDEAKTPEEEKLENLRNLLIPIAEASQKSGADCGGYFAGHDKSASGNSGSCSIAARCDFTPIQGTGGNINCGGMMPGVNTNKHVMSNCGTANTSTNASPFTSPQMTPLLSRSRHNSGQTSSTYLTPRSTPFNPDDNLNIAGYSTNSTANTTPFMSPVMTPQFSRSRHNSQNHRMHPMAPAGCGGNQMSQLHPGTTIGPPNMGSSGVCGGATAMAGGANCSLGAAGSRSRHSSGARRFPYSVPEDHAPHQVHFPYLQPSHHHRVQQRRLRNSSGGGIPPSPHSAPLSPLIDGQEFYSSGPMSQPGGGGGGGGNISSDYRRRHTSAGPLIHNHQPTPVPLNQNQMLSSLSSSNQIQGGQLNPNNRLHNLPNMSALQLSPLNEPSNAQSNNIAPDQSNLSSNRPQSVPLPEMLCNQQYSLSVPSTPLLHPNQQPLSHNQQSLAQGGLTTDNIMNHNRAHGCYSSSGITRHFSFDASLPPSCAPTPVPSEYADFNSESCLDGIAGLDTLDSLDPIEPMSQSTPPNVSPFRNRSSFQCHNSNSIAGNVCGDTTMTCATGAGNLTTNNSASGSCGGGSNIQLNRFNNAGLAASSSSFCGPNTDCNPTLGSVTCSDGDAFDGNTGLGGHNEGVFDGNTVVSGITFDGRDVVSFGGESVVVSSASSESRDGGGGGDVGNVFGRDFAATTIDRGDLVNDNNNANNRNPFISGNSYNIFSSSESHTNNSIINSSNAGAYDNNRGSTSFNTNNNNHLNNNDDGGSSLSNSNSGGLFSPTGVSNMNQHPSCGLHTPFSPDNQTCHSFQVSGQSGSSEITLNALNTAVLSSSSNNNLIHSASGATSAGATLSNVNNNNNPLDTSGGLGLSSSVSDIGDGFGSLEDVFQLASGGSDLRDLDL